MNATEWFRDVPWYNLPPSMSGRLLEPVRPPLRLLGGSAPAGKTSKLAALAAARKKKEAEAKENTVPSNSTSLLDRLSTKPASQANSVSTPQPATPSEKTFPIRKRKSPSPPVMLQDRKPSSPGLRQQSQLPQEPSQNAQYLRSDPSIFAQTMCGKPSKPPEPAPHFANDLSSTLLGSQDYSQANNPFAGPSPDDVVTQAQAKGVKGSTAG